MMIFVSSSFVKLILVLVTLLSPPSSGRYLMSYAGNDFLNDLGDPSLIALNTPTLVQLKQMIDAQLAARAYLRCRTLFGPCPPPIPREQSLTVVDSVRIKVPAMEESAAADSKSPSGVDEATTTTEDGDGIILWPSGNDQQSNVPENETTESADCDEDNCGQETDAGDGQLGQDFLQSQIESSSTTEEGEVVSAEVEGTESATIVTEAAESTTIVTEAAELTTIVTESAESTTIAPELAESTTIAPELAELTTIAPELAESTTIAPELAESTTIAPESPESTESTKTESAEQIAETTTLPSTTAAIFQPQSSEQPISASVPPSTTEEPTFSTSGQIGLVNDDNKDDEDNQIPLYDDTTQPPRLRDSVERRDAEKDEINPLFRSLGFSVMFEDLPPSPDFLRIAEERLKKATMA